jgi:hypothetical protein
MFSGKPLFCSFWPSTALSCILARRKEKYSLQKKGKKQNNGRTVRAKYVTVLLNSTFSVEVLFFAFSVEK